MDIKYSLFQTVLGNINFILYDYHVFSFSSMYSEYKSGTKVIYCQQAIYRGFILTTLLPLSKMVYWKIILLAD